MKIYKEILDPITKAHHHFDLVDYETDTEMVAERKVCQLAAEALQTKQSTAKATLAAIDVAALSKLTQASQLTALRDAVQAIKDILGA
jgi:NurA-like 5'-3' nuclease